MINHTSLDSVEHVQACPIMTVGSYTLYAYKAQTTMALKQWLTKTTLPIVL